MYEFNRPSFKTKEELFEKAEIKESQLSKNTFFFCEKNIKCYLF